MSELLYNILKSQLFAPFVIVWLIICVANQSARKSFLSRLSILVSKPIIFEKDEYPNDSNLYPRRLLEQIATMFQKAFTQPLEVVIDQFKLWIRLQASFAYRPETPIRIVGYFLYLALFILFVWANAISVVTSLDILRIFDGPIPALLTSFEVAVFMGTLGSAIVAGLVLMDIQSERSVLSNWDEHRGMWKRTATTFALIIIFLVLLIVMALGLQRLSTIGVLTGSVMTTAITNFTIIALVPVNNILSTVLISYEAILGILVVLVVIQLPLLGIMYILNYLLSIMGTLLPILLDIIYRILLLILDLLFYLILSPIDTVFGIARWIEQRAKGQ